MKLPKPQRSTVIIGFDSAWTDDPKNPGAICAIAFDGGSEPRFCEPELATFAHARDYVEKRRKEFEFSLVAIDQPTIVPNPKGMRPVEKVAASPVSYARGGVQPANRGKTKMFGKRAPIWGFLDNLDAKKQDPLAARTAPRGHYLIEVFPTLALLALKDEFAERPDAPRCCAPRRGAPKYNPKNRKKFCRCDWNAVAGVVEDTAGDYKVSGLASWARNQKMQESDPRPPKCRQDKLDAAICALVGLAWRAPGGPIPRSAMLGDLENGYMVTPIPKTRGPWIERIKMGAQKHDVRIRCKQGD